MNSVILGIVFLSVFSVPSAVNLLLASPAARLSMSDPSEFDHPGSGTPSALPGGFRAAITVALSGMGYAVTGWEPDGVNVIAPDRDGEQYIGLSNLYRRAKQAEKVEWGRMIREFLGHVTGVLAGPKIPDNLNTVADQLRPRLGKPFAHEGKAHPWG